MLLCWYVWVDVSICVDSSQALNDEAPYRNGYRDLLCPI